MKQGSSVGQTNVMEETKTLDGADEHKTIDLKLADLDNDYMLQYQNFRVTEPENFYKGSSSKVKDDSLNLDMDSSKVDNSNAELLPNFTA